MNPFNLADPSVKKGPAKIVISDSDEENFDLKVDFLSALLGEENVDVVIIDAEETDEDDMISVKQKKELQSLMVDTSAMVFQSPFKLFDSEFFSFHFQKT